MDANPIPEAVSVTLHSDRAGCEWFIVTSKNHSDSESEITPSDDPALFDLLKSLTAAQQQVQAVVWVSAAEIAPFIGAPQMAALWGTVTLASGPGDGRTVPLYLTAPPSAPVGVEATTLERIALLFTRSGTYFVGDRDECLEKARQAVALAQQPAAVDRRHPYVQSKDHGGCANCGYPEHETMQHLATQHKEPTT